MQEGSMVAVHFLSNLQQATYKVQINLSTLRQKTTINMKHDRLQNNTSACKDTALKLPSHS